MSDRTRRFVQLGVIGTALEEPSEQQVLTDFIINTILPSEGATKKLGELVVNELVRLKLTGSGESFTTITARNRVDLNGIVQFLEKTFESEWTKRG